MSAIGILTIVFAVVAVIAVIFCLLFNLKIKKISLYWLVSLFGAVVIALINVKNIDKILSPLIANSSINPVKILVFFLSMTVLSIILDNLNFFNFLANKCVKFAKKSQFKLFLIFYCFVSILTIFTSNDIVILAFVPFICYFCKSANINPAPYVFSTFVAANTWSMLFVIGNPTNVYLASFAGIDFLSYFLKMALPTLACGIISFLLLLLLFKKHLKEKIENVEIKEIELNKPLVIINLTMLLSCTVLLAVGSYIGLEMWIIALGFSLSAILINIVFCIIKKIKMGYIANSIKRAPWEFVPFLLSMFIIVMCLEVNGITKLMADLITNNNQVWLYGIFSFLFSNIMNNISMTSLFASLISNGGAGLSSVYASIIGSNLGAIFTPIGALAGIMFLNILKEKQVDFSIKSFIKYGVIVSIVSLAVSLSIVYLL